MELPSDDMPVSVVEGDALDVMRVLPSGLFDAVITDPPYAVTSEASSSVARGRRTTVRETQFFEAWLREHLREFVRLLKPTGAVWMSIDWRGAMALDESCVKLGIREPKIGVWDKAMIGMGYLLRNSYECFAVVAMDGFERKTASEPDVWRHPWGQAGRDTDHAAEKPIPLMRRAVRLLTDPGDLIIDPFAGSGSTLVAAACEGRRAFGIEREPEFCATARRRVAEAMGTGLLAGIA